MVRIQNQQQPGSAIRSGVLNQVSPFFNPNSNSKLEPFVNKKGLNLGLPMETVNSVINTTIPREEAS
jgi:hypothetical protein